MKVFLSWSGDKSKAIALILKVWLKDVIQPIDPWMSDEDIKKGGRWNPEIAKQLKERSVGIICLTKENMLEPWILFEAGALSKIMDESYVCTFLYNLSKTDVKGPLAQFQATTATDQNDVRRMLNTLNEALKEGTLDKERLDRSFERCWPELEKKLGEIASFEEKKEPARTSEDKIDEILVTVRNLQKLQEETLSAPISEWSLPSSPYAASRGATVSFRIPHSDIQFETHPPTITTTTAPPTTTTPAPPTTTTPAPPTTTPVIGGNDHNTNKKT